MTVTTSASERARQRWNKEPMSFRDIDQLATREEKAAAIVVHFEHIERLERAKRRPNNRLLAEIATKKRDLGLIARGETEVSEPATPHGAPVRQLDDARGPRERSHHEPKKDRDR